MPYSVSSRNAALDVNLNPPTGQYISLHNGDPGSAGANEISGGSPAYARLLCAIPAASNGTTTGAQITFNVPAGSGTHYGAWTAASGGTWIGGWPLPNGGYTYGSQGTVTITPTFNETGT